MSRQYDPHHRPQAATAAIRTVALTLALALSLLAGCAGNSGGSQSASSTTRASATSSTTSTAPAAPTAVAEGQVAKGAPVPSKGCGSSASTATATDQRLDIGDRFYLLSTPADPTADTPLPLVLDLHGLLEGAVIHTHMTELGPYGATHGFLTVTPNGSGKPIKWDVSLDRSKNPDLVFLDAALDQVEAQRCVDTSRVYATGLSYGAIMSSTLGCVMTDRIAAIAPVDGLTVPPKCTPDRPIPVLTFHGTRDPILLFNGGVANLSGLLGGADDTTVPPPAELNGNGYPEAAATWATQNGCVGKPVDTKRTASVIERTWDCPASSPVVFEIMVGAGHSWPGSTFSKGAQKFVGPTDFSIDGRKLIWDFFQRFQLPAHTN